MYKADDIFNALNVEPNFDITYKDELYVNYEKLRSETALFCN